MKTTIKALLLAFCLNSAYGLASQTPGKVEPLRDFTKHFVFEPLNNTVYLLAHEVDDLVEDSIKFIVLRFFPGSISFIYHMFGGGYAAGAKTASLALAGYMVLDWTADSIASSVESIEEYFMPKNKVQEDDEAKSLFASTANDLTEDFYKLGCMNQAVISFYAAGSMNDLLRAMNPVPSALNPYVRTMGYAYSAYAFTKDYSLCNEGGDLYGDYMASYFQNKAVKSWEKRKPTIKEGDYSRALLNLGMATLVPLGVLKFLREVRNV